MKIRFNTIKVGNYSRRYVILKTVTEEDLKKYNPTSNIIPFKKTA